ncbi:hypothetical protein Tco_0410118 [Tanacetum coccineum]
MIHLSLRLPLQPESPTKTSSSSMLPRSGQPIFPYGRRTRTATHLNGRQHQIFIGAQLNHSSRHSLPDHSSPDLPGTSAGLSRKRRRSPMTSVPALSPVSGALSPVRADLIPSPKRVRDSGYLTDVEVDHRETSLRDDAIAIPVHRIQTIEGVQREQGHRIVGVESAVIALTERLAELERDNRRLRGTMSVEKLADKRHAASKHKGNRSEDVVSSGSSRALSWIPMPNTRSGASMTREEFEELVARRVAEELEAREAARTLEP